MLSFKKIFLFFFLFLNISVADWKHLDLGGKLEGKFNIKSGIISLKRKPEMETTTTPTTTESITTSQTKPLINETSIKTKTTKTTMETTMKSTMKSTTKSPSNSKNYPTINITLEQISLNETKYNFSSCEKDDFEKFNCTFGTKFITFSFNEDDDLAKIKLSYGKEMVVKEKTEQIFSLSSKIDFEKMDDSKITKDNNDTYVTYKIDSIDTQFIFPPILDKKVTLSERNYVINLEFMFKDSFDYEFLINPGNMTDKSENSGPSFFSKTNFAFEMLALFIIYILYN